MESVLIANRGEIAVRIIRTCKRLGLVTVAVYADVDKDAYYTRLADYAVCIGPNKPEKSYLNKQAIIAIAKAYNVTAIHPGIGFLSENAEFAEMCFLENIIFIGPDSNSIRLLGDKAKARQIMSKNNIPIPKGSDGTINTFNEALKVAEYVGFPLIIKAAMGGGGKGIRVVEKKEDLESSFYIVKQEALSSFGNDGLYIESYLMNSKHIEVQIMADYNGNVLHLGTRECSIQRKKQKLIEEAPAPFLEQSLMDSIQKYAVQIAEIVSYKNIGTVEFLITEDKKIYFIEMNTRLQIEHTITEEIYRLDLVECQIHIALKHEFNLTQDKIIPHGHAIECRINAEAPENNFYPSSGEIKTLLVPGGFGVRVESGYIAKDRISPYYDSLVLKLICYGHTRKEAINSAYTALQELTIDGIKTNINFTKSILENKDFLSGNFDSAWVDNTFLSQTLANRKKDERLNNETV